jgi:hypothetical protein
MPRGSVKTRLWVKSRLETEAISEPTEGFDRTSNQNGLLFGRLGGTRKLLDME